MLPTPSPWYKRSVPLEKFSSKPAAGIDHLIEYYHCTKFGASNPKDAVNFAINFKCYPPPLSWVQKSVPSERIPNAPLSGIDQLIDYCHCAIFGDFNLKGAVNFTIKLKWCPPPPPWVQKCPPWKKSGGAYICTWSAHQVLSLCQIWGF